MVKLDFVAANGMVLEVVEAFQLIFNERVGKHRVLVLIRVIHLLSCVTVAGHDHVDKEDRDAGNEENRMFGR